MAYFTKKEILENLKSAIEESDKKDSLAHIIVSYYNRYDSRNPYIAGNDNAVDALSNFAQKNHTTLFALIDYLQDNAYFYGGQWNNQRATSELEIALIEKTVNKVLGKTKDKQIALQKINDSLVKTSNTESVLLN